MNRFIILLLTLLSVHFGQAQDKLRIVTSASIFHDMAINIGMEKVECFSIVPIGGDPHLYEPKPSDAQLVKSADVILVNGLTFEGWIAKLIENSGTSAKTYTITEGVDVIQSDTYENAADPHAWMDVRNGYIYIRNIRNALIDLLPNHREHFEKNYKKYLAELQALDQYIRQEVERIPSAQRVLITSHYAFQYYGRGYGIQL